MEYSLRITNLTSKPWLPEGGASVHAAFKTRSRWAGWNQIIPTEVAEDIPSTYPSCLFPSVQNDVLGPIL